MLFAPLLNEKKQIFVYHIKAVMADKKKFNKRDPKDLETIINIFLCESDDDEAIVLDESDTDEEEHISIREDDLETE
ncbi:hypothetical protein NPIL_501571 [Nephila pilipes]|uniref:Uncharacterized protein n=1 Tax=Nephila pilipes TaxID=299642 RepID=A0A8X6MTL9_NEPPI|nr:hypothetical protein NPIL_501571 [Nephila pilipes]